MDNDFFTLLLTDLGILIMILESTDSRTFEAYIQPASNCCVSEVPEVLVQKQSTLKNLDAVPLKFRTDLLCVATQTHCFPSLQLRLIEIINIL